MSHTTPLEPMPAELLIREVERYLAAVDLYRGLGCDLDWRPERTGTARERPRKR